MTYAVRVDHDPATALAAVRQAIDQIDPRVPWFGTGSQMALIDASLRQERLFAYAASGFALLALLLACLGIYGTVAYAVARRTREIGLRMALGADRRTVVGMVLRESLMPVLAGAALGLVAAGATTRLLTSMLFGLTPQDVPTILAATLGLVISAIIAGWLPSLRATTVESDDGAARPVGVGGGLEMAIAFSASRP